MADPLTPPDDDFLDVGAYADHTHTHTHAEPAPTDADDEGGAS